MTFIAPWGTKINKCKIIMRYIFTKCLISEIHNFAVHNQNCQHICIGVVVILNTNIFFIPLLQPCLII